MSDDYGHKISMGQMFIRGNYLEKVYSSNKTSAKYKCMEKLVYFYKGNVVYPFVNFEKQNQHYFVISNNDFCEVISYVQHYGMGAL